ncbi:MAG: lipoyl synthase [Gemmatimonadota bacterium]
MSAVRPPGRPPWLKVRPPAGPAAERVADSLRRRGLRTVCREARCPNLGECWSAGTATVLVLGPSCTRACAFCAVSHGLPAPPDPGEPSRVAAAAAELGWKTLVVTSVTRDDLPDGGAGHFARIVQALRGLPRPPEIELLVPDFGGSPDALRTVVDARPDVLAHNVETVPRLYPRVRPGAVYARSLELLSRARDMAPDLALKSGLMAGFGETRDELARVLEDLSAVGCRSVTLGQYLPPGPGHVPVAEYLAPEAFAELGETARRLGFARVVSGPLVRSSYRPAAR